ncbi:Delta-1-Pyrroline-5-Carboxylate Synthase [Manis pentadactyla]|nr:Delta-1-Pyrroline-5-Carboxylate Synthase [Manis pentadactyla]
MTDRLETQDSNNVFQSPHTLNAEFNTFLENKNKHSTYWNQGYSYQQGYGPGYGGSDDSLHGYYGYGPGYYYRRSVRKATP